MTESEDTIRVLHVDDEPQFSDIVSTFLEREDDRIDVQTVTSPEEGREVLSNHGIDCVVSDYDMPDTNGVEFLEAVRADYPDLPFILFTGMGSEAVASEAISAGVTDYLQKEPGTSQYTVLANRIQNAVESYHTEKALEAARNRYEKVVEQNLAGIYIIQDGEFVYINPKLAEIHGYDEDTIIGMSPLELVAPGERERVQENLRKRLDGEVADIQYQTIGLTKDGEHIDIELHGSRIEYRGRPAVIGAELDITERKQREQDLQEKTAELEATVAEKERQNRAFNSFLDIVNDTTLSFDEQMSAVLDLGVEFLDLDIGIVSNIDPPAYTVEHVVTPDGSIEQGDVLDFSDTFCTLVYDADGPVAFHSPEEGAVKDHPCYQDLGLHAYLGEPLIVDEERYGTLNFSSPSTRGEPFTGSERAFIRTIGEWVSRTLARQQRDLELERYETILTATGDPVYTLDADGVFTYVNEALLEFSGYSKTELLGSNASVVMEQGDYERGSELIRSLLNSAEASGTFEMDLLTADGDRIPCENHIAILPFQDEFRGTVGVLRDISDRVDRERRYNAIFNQTYQYTGLLEPDGTLIEANETALEFGGIEREDVVGKRLWETTWFQHSDETEQRTRNAVERAAAGEFVRHELPVQGANREAIIDFSVRPVTNAQGEVTYIIPEGREITDRKEREQRLEETMSRLEALFENSPDMIDVLDQEGTLIDVNQRFCEELGYTEEEILGRHIWDIDQEVSEDDVKTLLSDFDLDERRKFEGEYERHDGSTFPVEVHLMRVDIDGENRFLAISRDITERKQYERTISALHDAAQDIFRTETTDEAAETIVEAVRDVLGLSINGVAFHDEAEDVLRTVAMTELGEQIVGEPPIFRPDESLAWEVFESGEPKRYDDVSTMPGRHNPETIIRSELIVPLGEYGVVIVGATEPDEFTDVDLSLVETLAMHAETALDRISRERALDRSEDRYRSLTDDVLDTSSVGTFILDEDFQIVWINEATEEYFGIDRETVLGEDKRQLIHDHIKHTVDDSDGFAETVLATYDDNTYVEEFECRVMPGDDRDERWLKHWSQPINSGLYQGGRIEHYTDITERKRRERELSRQNERLAEFTSIVSHDLRNPLSIAEGRLELAREECESDHLDGIANAHERMNGLIEDLLKLAREGEEIDDLGPVDLATLTETSWQNVATAQATLTVDVDGVIQTDKSRLQQLLENLFRNAIEHGGEDVTVTVGEVDDGFYVEDTGPGIPSEDRDKVFEAGYSTSEEGTGFGLSIVKQVVDAHDWAISVTEGSEGGARFEITGVEEA